MYPLRMVQHALRLRLPVTTIAVVLLALLLALAVVGCSFGEGVTGASQKQKAPKGTFELPNGRSLYIECRGSGSPTIVFEVGLEEPISDVSYVQHTLAREYMTCAYDRANNGQSGKAPTPRTAGDVVNDLHQLLETADVPGPYVLAGSSYGGVLRPALRAPLFCCGRRCGCDEPGSDCRSSGGAHTSIAWIH